MARVVKQRSPRPAIAIIVDGEDEKWYISKAKEYYPSEALRRTKVKPEIVQHKKCLDLFLSAKDRIGEGYLPVVLLLDLDTIRKDPVEMAAFKDLYSKFLAVRMGRCENVEYLWMKDLKVLINNPCLEYWYLLHFRKTKKFFDCYGALRADLKSIKELSGYEKSEKYYLGSPNIFERLGALKGLAIARENSKGCSFDVQDCDERGISEMALLFDLFDSLV